MSSNIVCLDVNLESLINGILTQKSQSNDRDYSHFHPSEFSQCHRKLVYKFYQAKGICSFSEPEAALIEPRLQRIFDNGHLLHVRLRENLEHAGVLRGRWQCAKCQKKFGTDIALGVAKPSKCDCGSARFHYREVGFLDDETLIGGHVDAILDLRGFEINGQKIPLDAPESDSQIIVDFKSIRSEGFRHLIGPKEDHYSQMQIYLYLSGLRAGKFLYENKNDQMFREYLVVRNDAFISDIVAKAKVLKRIVSNTNSSGQWTLPDRAHKKDNTKECVECPFRSHCWKLKK